MPQRYRCDQCEATSPLLFSDAGLDRERRTHRMLSHAGMIPDGERTIHVERLRLADVPPGQLIVSAVLAVLLALYLVARLT